MILCLHQRDSSITNAQTTQGSACASDSCTIKPGWIIGAYTFSRLKASGASPTLINTAFSNNDTFVVGDGHIGVPTVTYQSYQKIDEALADGTLPGNYKAVMYDNENWSFTPAVEQQHPDEYEHLVGDLLHRHGLLYITAPAADIVRASGTPIDNNTQDTYLSRNVAGGAAQYADVIDIQAQYLEPDLSKFTHFVTTAAAQARKANPKIKVYVGIATGPDGQSVTFDQLYGAYKTIRSIADGYWLNLSGKSTYCPNCVAPKPQLAAQLLQTVYGLK